MYLVLKDFKTGMDRRRPRSAGEPGTVYTLEDGVITRGGDFEVRKEFVEKYNLPAGTFGLHAITDTLYAFGSDDLAGSMPAGVSYQRLIHPGGTSYSMTSLDCVETFNGLPYAVATFDDGFQYHFYDAEWVPDWGAGEVRAYMVDNDGIASHLGTVIDQDDNFETVVAANQITVTGETGVDFTINITTVNGGATDDQNVTISITQEAVATVDETAAIGTFSILGGSTAAGTNKVSQVSAGGTNLLSAAVDFATTNGQTAANIAAAINAYSGTSGYSASSRLGVVYVYAPDGDGVSANNRVIQVTAAGNVVVADGHFAVTGGTVSAGVNKIASVKANGVEILTGPGTDIDYTTDNSTTAAAIATAIRAYSGTSGYTAYADGETVRVSKLVTNSNDPDVTLSVDYAGDVTIGSGSAPSTPIEDPTETTDEFDPPPPGTEVP